MIAPAYTRIWMIPMKKAPEQGVDRREREERADQPERAGDGVPPRHRHHRRDDGDAGEEVEEDLNQHETEMLNTK
jgi:hypothetical protein